MVYRIYVEKKPGFDVEATGLKNELTSLLGIKELSGLRLLNRYDVEGIDEELFNQCADTVFSEPPVDNTYAELPASDGVSFAVEYLPGQFDQRADSAAECIQLISQGERPLVRSARVYLLEGALTDEQVAEIKKYVINPVEAREASLDTKQTLKMEYPVPAPVKVLEGFNQLDEEQLKKFIADNGLAMDLGDIEFCQKYFRSEHRDPTITEIKMIDTYWSDHCRHTTFGTILDDVQIDDAVVQKAFDRYMAMRADLGRENKPRCMMDLATIGAKELKKQGILKNLDESDEINACTVKIKCDVNGKDEDWLFLFKNETHNHPTEIEPFGGAATCIGGAIRDPLSGRSYVYQAMRVTGAGDPLKPVSETLPGKLPQRKLVTTAAAGYSSYGNQIGLATGQVDEIYHPGYVAKRMEIGAVVGATPASHVRRECPAPGDVIVLLGGRTGRDGVGGATGSSKAHKLDSLEGHPARQAPPAEAVPDGGGGLLLLWQPDWPGHRPCGGTLPRGLCCQAPGVRRGGGGGPRRQRPQRVPCTWGCGHPAGRPHGPGRHRRCHWLLQEPQYEVPDHHGLRGPEGQRSRGAEDSAVIPGRQCHPSD